MSSSTFSTELRPEPRLRWLVVLSGVGMLLLGLVVISSMSAGVAVRVPGALAWLGVGGYQLHRLVRCYQLCRRIRINEDGSAEIATAGGAWRVAELQTGSVVLQRIAWLRIDAGGRRKFAELFVGNCRENESWRRLQIIWRHLGSAA